jgi:plastocyanin
MNADPSCAALHSEPVRLDTMVTDGEGHLANVFAYLKEGPGLTGNAAPEEPHLLDQEGCQYVPHVSGMQVGQTLKIRNGDATLHNVHAVPEQNREFNFGQPFQGMEIEQVFKSSEVMIRFKCDVHPWMSAYIGVLEHPFFAVSAKDGTFAIEGIPAGTYTLEAWHEELGTRTLTVTLQESGMEDVAIDF